MHSNKRIITVILLIAVLAVAGTLALYITSSYSTVPINPPTVYILPTKPIVPVSLMLKAKKTTVRVGDEIAIQLVVDAQHRKINGIDSVLTISSPDALVFVEFADPSPRFLFPRIKQDKDRMIITALRQLFDNQPTGEEVLGTLMFKAKKQGEITLDFIFTKGATTGSLVVDDAANANILTRVAPLVLHVEK